MESLSLLVLVHRISSKRSSRVKGRDRGVRRRARGSGHSTSRCGWTGPLGFGILGRAGRGPSSWRRQGIRCGGRVGVGRGHRPWTRCSSCRSIPSPWPRLSVRDRAPAWRKGIIPTGRDPGGSNLEARVRGLARAGFRRKRADRTRIDPRMVIDVKIGSTSQLAVAASFVVGRAGSRSGKNWVIKSSNSGNDRRKNVPLFFAPSSLSNPFLQIRNLAETPRC